MKKLILISLSVFIPLITGASFDKNLYYGLQSDSQVKELQEFLTDQGVYSGPITGNFFSLTLKAVKSFQQREGISQTGYFGPLSRTSANNFLSADIESSNQGAVAETGTIPPTPEPAKTTNDVVKSLQDQIALLIQQIALLQTQTTTLQQTQQQVQQIQQNTQQIAQNTTCVPNWQCGSWSACAYSQQTLICNDLNNCGVDTGRPGNTQDCIVPKIIGCMDNTALNYNPNAEINDGCIFADLKYEIKEFIYQATQGSEPVDVIQKWITLTAVNDDFVINEIVLNSFYNKVYTDGHADVYPPYFNRVNALNDNKGLGGLGFATCNEPYYSSQPLICPDINIYQVREVNGRISGFQITIKKDTSFQVPAGEYINGELQNYGYGLTYFKATGVKTGKIITLP
jgi:peptidoglycan hydrolase-like protein with peptidoglycan-binding domain